MAKFVSPHDKSLKNDSTTKRVRFEVPNVFINVSGQGNAEADDLIQNLDSVTITPCEEISHRDPEVEHFKIEENTIDNIDNGENGENSENGYGISINAIEAIASMASDINQFDVSDAFVSVSYDGNEGNGGSDRDRGNNNNNNNNHGDDNNESDDDNTDEVEDGFFDPNNNDAMTDEVARFIATLAVDFSAAWMNKVPATTASDGAESKEEQDELFQHATGCGDTMIMVVEMDNAERRNGDSNMEQLLLDSASTISIATTPLWMKSQQRSSGNNGNSNDNNDDDNDKSIGKRLESKVVPSNTAVSLELENLKQFASTDVSVGSNAERAVQEQGGRSILVSASEDGDNVDGGAVVQQEQGERFKLKGNVNGNEGLAMNTSDINSKNTKIDIHKKMADRLYNGLIMAEVEGSAIDVNKSNKKSSKSSKKEDVEYSNAIVIDELLPRENDLERASRETL
jgi:hypothetical protein